MVREGSLVLTAYVGATASDDRAAARKNCFPAIIRPLSCCFQLNLEASKVASLSHGGPHKNRSALIPAERYLEGSCEPEFRRYIR